MLVWKCFKNNYFKNVGLCTLPDHFIKICIILDPDNEQNKAFCKIRNNILNCSVKDVDFKACMRVSTKNP